MFYGFIALLFLSVVPVAFLRADVPAFAFDALVARLVVVFFALARAVVRRAVVRFVTFTAPLSPSSGAEVAFLRVEAVRRVVFVTGAVLSRSASATCAVGSVVAAFLRVVLVFLVAL